MNIATPKASEEDLIKAGRWAHIKPQVFNLDSDDDVRVEEVICL